MNASPGDLSAHRREITEKLARLAERTPRHLSPVDASYAAGVADVARWLVHGTVDPALQQLLHELENESPAEPEEETTMANTPPPEELAAQADAAKELAADQHAILVEKAGDPRRSCQ